MGRTGSGSGNAEPRVPGGGRWPRGSLASAAADVLAAVGGPLSLKDLVAELGARQWQLGADGRRRLRGALHQHPLVCRVDTATYDLVERRLVGARLRHVLTASELRHGMLFAEPDLSDLVGWWLPPGHEAKEVRWFDETGTPGQARILLLLGPQPAGSFSALFHGERLYRVLDGLSAWLGAKGAHAGDEVVICPEPPDARTFRLHLERGGQPDATLAEADAHLADTALDILTSANTLLTSHDLLHRLAGRMDLRVPKGVHLPVFVLGRDPRFAFSSPFYGLRAVVEALDRRRISSPYPRPEDYPADWPERNALPTLARLVENLLPEALADALARGMDDETAVRSLAPRLGPRIAQRAARERIMLWELLQDQSRLLNPPTRRPARGVVIRGPWPG